MFESALIKERAAHGMSQSECAGHQGVSVSVDVQIELIREAALTLIEQLDLLRPDESMTRSTAQSGEQGENSRQCLHDEVRRFEIELISNALFRTHGHQQKAARLLGIKGTTLNSKIKRYNIMLPFFRGVSLTERTERAEDVVEVSHNNI